MNIYYKYLIDKYDVISFDVFDTLILRKDIEPERMYEKIGGIILGENNKFFFVRKRIFAEKMSRLKKTEVTLDDIYDCYDDSRNFVENAKKCELEYEKDNCLTRKSGMDLYSYAVRKNKKIIAISDMYLKKCDIEFMLKKCGYKEFDNIFVSNEYDSNKSSGELFVLARGYIDGCDLLHIGDSIKADFLGAKKANVKAVLLLKEHMICRYVFRMYTKWMLKCEQMKF